MADRFRELERPQAGRPKDIVLMATVSSFESLRFPSRSDLRQFAELFQPLYDASSEEARRQAVAVLSRCPLVPDESALFIATRPIGVAAIFLTGSKAIPDSTLMRVLGASGPDHAHAIGRRDDLSPAVIEALAGTHRRHAGEEALQDAARREREEEIRDELRALVRAAMPASEASVGLRPATDAHQALLVRFARAGEAGMLAVTLADALDASQWLSERILLDVSGRQLAETLLALDMPDADSLFVLETIYPHLSDGGARTLLFALDPAEAVGRVESWQRADSYTNGIGPPKAANTHDGEADGQHRRGRLSSPVPHRAAG